MQDRIFITKWAPQLSVLGHRAIRMAILHGGSNGLHEALYNEIPPIVIPVAGDQVANAGRVHYQNLGIHIPSRNLSEASITDAIKSIDRGNYQASVERLKINFVAAGGVERAAKLVEFYEAVGYSHLIPAYAKYNWSWVQYYNVDVYLILSVALVTLTYSLLLCCRCTSKKVYTRCVCTSSRSTSSKEKTD